MATQELAHLSLAVEDLPPLGFIHDRPFAAELLTSPTNVNWVKPQGGLWASPITAPQRTVWTDWLEQEQADLYSADLLFHSVSLAPATRILRIDSLEDLREVLSAYFYDSDLFAQLQLPYCLLDFEAMARDWDGLYLTDEGQWATRLPPLGQPSLYGWDLESLCLFNGGLATVGAPQPVASSMLVQ